MSSRKVKISLIEYEGDRCYLIETLGCACPEWFITCKEGYNLLKLSKIIPSGGDSLGYTRTNCGNRIHNILAPTKEKLHVDHINRDRRDNRIINLRLVTPKENAQNGSVHVTNKLGIKYISWSKHAKSYRVVIDSKHVGYYKELSIAVRERNNYLTSIDHPYSIKLN